jgi:hypothetical protein
MSKLVDLIIRIVRGIILIGVMDHHIIGDHWSGRTAAAGREVLAVELATLFATVLDERLILLNGLL